MGPIRPEARSRVHLSSFGVITKSNKPGRWRLIVDLSCPRSRSVNEGILSALALLRYSRVPDAFTLLSAFRGHDKRSVVCDGSQRRLGGN